MAASGNTNQISLSGDAEGQVSASGRVVLLKNENLTLQNGTAVAFGNIGNYKAIKVDDSNGNAQYICSFKGVRDVVKFALFNTSGTIVEYPVMQHSFEYSDNLTPLADFDDRVNQLILYDQSVGGGQSRTQRFQDTYQTEGASTFEDRCSYDYLKGAAVGDVVSFSFYRNQKVKLKRTGELFDDGRIHQLQGNSDVYQYVIDSVTMPNDERVDGNKSYSNTDKGVWSVRPGINKVAFDTVTSNNRKALDIFIDAQGFRTGGANELGWTEDTFGDDYGFILFKVYDKNLEVVGEEVLLMNPNTPGFDLSGRFLGSYVTNYEATNDQFPLYVDLQCWFSAANIEYALDSNHFWSEYDAGYGSISATNPDIMANEKLDDPWCLDRQYSAECEVQIDNENNPWGFYRFQSDATGTGGGTLPSTITKKAYSQGVVNQKIQYTGSVVKQTQFIVKSDSEYTGLVNNYSFKSKKFRISTQDRPSMIRTVSVTYKSKNNLLVRFYTDKNLLASQIIFDNTEALNGTIEQVSTTKVVGLRAKTFSIEISGVGSTPETIEISKVSIAYG